MRARILFWMLIGVGLLSPITSFAQSNIYSLSVRTRWTIGTYPAKFGLEGYRKDESGHYVIAGGTRAIVDASQTNSHSRVYEYTSVWLGPVAFTVPQPPLFVALLGALIFLAFCPLIVSIVRLLHRRKNAYQLVGEQFTERDN